MTLVRGEQGHDEGQAARLFDVRGQLACKFFLSEVSE